MNNGMMTDQQQYDLYTAEDLEVWATLFMRQMIVIRTVAYRHFAGQLKKLGFTAEVIPDFCKTNGLLTNLTGWQIYAVPGRIPSRLFFRFMLNKHFGATTRMRRKEQLDDPEDPDMFHDVFGHVPLLADPVIANYLHGLARIAGRYIDQENVIEAIARLYWYTIGFGLIKEHRDTKIYGAAILSSIAETQFVMSPVANYQPFNLRVILETPYVSDRFQEQYFVLDSLGQLKTILKELDHLLRSRYE
jgi:phenylalanine-4-hydroxylase